MAFHSFQILVHRPFLCLFDALPEGTQSIELQKLDVAVSAPSICRTSALEITKLCRTYRQHYSLQCIVFMVAHYLTNVCTIHIIDSESDDESVAQGADIALAECLDILGEMAKVWETARNSIVLINELKATRERRNIANSTSEEMDMETQETQPAVDFLASQFFENWDLDLMFPNMRQNTAYF
jgi:hypothetical protein